MFKDFWETVSWPTLVSVIFLTFLAVTLVLPTVPVTVVLTLGFLGVTAAILALRDKQ